MNYYLTKFFRYIPNIDGMTVITGVDNFNIVSLATDTAIATLSAYEAHPFEGIPKTIPMVELTEVEALSAHKFYAETRGYRKAYSDLEGLEPDADELAKGGRKTKIYLTDDMTAATISLMKKAHKLHIDQEMEDRRLGLPNLDGTERPAYDADKHAELLTQADSLSSIDDHVEARETVLGLEMSKDLASRKGLWDDTRNARKEKVKFGYQF
jgi:hypothetical protein